MKRIAQFKKVSFEQFKTDINKIFDNKYTDVEIRTMYDNIELPKRATTDSAGYDFKLPMTVELDKNIAHLIPTGIRAKIDSGWVLKLYPRSGLGFKHGLKLLNTVGVIDGDYYNSDNEGHIMAKIKQTEKEKVILQNNSAFIQGVFVEYGITEDDESVGIRNGGFGSTGE